MKENHSKPFVDLKLSDYHYELPHERIAQSPLKERDTSKLLVYKQGQIIHSQFRELSTLLQSPLTMFFNDTKVIPARLFFRRASGALIEVLLLSPLKPSLVLEEAMAVEHTCIWLCMVGNLKKWKSGEELVLELAKGQLKAVLDDREKQTVHFEWNTATDWAAVIQEAGAMPLPPYIKRTANQDDTVQYQTVYSRAAGAVAAPTAGLHFTERVLQSLKDKQIGIDFLTLHVSAGTFQPLKADYVPDHTMQKEQLVVHRRNVQALLEAKQVLAVGTTAMRTLESLYWYGCMLCEDPSAPFFVQKLHPYQTKITKTRQEAFEAVLARMNSLKTDVLVGETEIFIFPSYDFKVCDALITNFHLPSTTLVLLVAAFVGEDWRKIYEAALNSDYRFLSFGDSSLLIPKPKGEI